VLNEMVGLVHFEFPLCVLFLNVSAVCLVHMKMILNTIFYISFFCKKISDHFAREISCISTVRPS
jgi:hypothetical protein